MLQTHKANDKHYDAFLTDEDAPEEVFGTFFTVSKYYDSLPNITQYPCNGEEGQYYGRVSVPLKLLRLHKAKYHMYKIHCTKSRGSTTVTQCLVLFVKAKNEIACRWLEQKQAQRLSKDDNGIFEYDLKCKVWWSPPCEKGTWVNIVVVGSIPLPSWDIVKHD